MDGITTNRQENGSGSFRILSPSVDAVNEFHISISGLPIEAGQIPPAAWRITTPRAAPTNITARCTISFKNNAGWTPTTGLTTAKSRC